MKELNIGDAISAIDRYANWRFEDGPTDQGKTELKLAMDYLNRIKEFVGDDKLNVPNDVVKAIDEFAYCDKDAHVIFIAVSDWHNTYTTKIITRTIAMRDAGVIKELNQRRKAGLILLLVLLGVFAVLTIICIPINYVCGESFANGAFKITAAVLGTLDFPLGVLGFIWERKDDMKKRNYQDAARIAKEEGNFEEYDKIARNAIGKKEYESIVNSVNVAIGQDARSDYRPTNYTYYL